MLLPFDAKWPVCLQHLGVIEHQNFFLEAEPFSPLNRSPERVKPILPNPRTPLRRGSLQSDQCPYV